MTEDASWENYESGPFCRHFGTPGDCESCLELCACGHKNEDHAWVWDPRIKEHRAGWCLENRCECPLFVEKADSQNA